MTLKAYSVKKSLAYNLFWTTVKKNSGMTVLFSMFMMLICPVYVLVEINNYFEYSTKAFEFDSTLSGFSLLISVLTCGAAVLYCFINFAFMYSKKSADVYFALPLTRKQLLFSRFFSSVVPTLVPVLLCYGSMGFILMLENVSGSLLHILYAMLFNILLIVLSCAVTMVFIVCAGSVTDLLISYAGINIGLIILALIFTVLCQEMLVGYSNYYDERLMLTASPILYGFATQVSFAENDYLLNRQLVTDLISVFFIATASLVLSVLLFDRRKSEKCTCAYAYRGMYYICALLVAFVCAFLMGILFGGGSFNLMFWVFGIAGALLGAATFGLITDRGFKKIKQSLMIGAVSYAVMLVLTLILWRGGLGYTVRIPKAEDIKTVSVSFDNVQVEFKNPEKVLALHKTALKSDINLPDGEVILAETVKDTTEASEYEKYQSATHINFKYLLKNGVEMRRSFRVVTRNCEKELTAIYKSDENIATIMATAKSFMEKVSIYGPSGQEGRYISTNITREETVKLVETYIKELKNADEDILYYDGKRASFYIDGALKDENSWKSLNLEIGDDFTETKALIEEMKLLERTEAEEK